MCFRPVYLLILLQTINVLSQIAHNKLNIDLDQNVGENDLLRDSAEKYMETSAEFPALINVDNSRNDVMNLSSLPYDSDDYQSLLSDEHSNYYRRQKRESKDSAPTVSKKKKGHRRHRKGHRSSKKSSRAKVATKPSRKDNDQKTKETAKVMKEVPKDLCQSHLRPGVVFRIHMTEALNKLMYRSYAHDNDESVVEADVEYLRLTRKVLVDEITKFEDLRWLREWNLNRTRLTVEHICNSQYYFMGSTPSMFSTLTEDMKRYCLFDGLYIDNIPYVIGDDGGIMAAVAPPVLHCDAATCTAVPFIDSIMFNTTLPSTNVRRVTKCQADCGKKCKNDPDCLNECTNRCEVIVINNTERPIPPYMPEDEIDTNI